MYGIPCEDSGDCPREMYCEDHKKDGKKRCRKPNYGRIFVIVLGIIVGFFIFMFIAASISASISSTSTSVESDYRRRYPGSSN